MQNFNTNQTRHLYVAEAIDANVDTNLDIAIKALASGELYVSYKNADGLIVRSDTFDPKKIVSLKKGYATGMDVPLMGHTIKAASRSGLSGKTISLIITIHDVIDFDSDFTFSATMVCNATNTASDSAFYNALAKCIYKALPVFDKKYPVFDVYVGKSGTVTKVTKTSADLSSATCVLLCENLQKFVRGKLTGEPIHISVASRIVGDETTWLADYTPVKIAAINANSGTYGLNVSISPTVYPSKYTIANLEHFSLGERGDVYRGFNYPNDYTPTYAVDLSKTYDMLSIEYFWAGDAENVQKSPRLIEIAMPHAVSDNPVDTLYATVAAAMNGNGSGSGAGA